MMQAQLQQRLNELQEEFSNGQRLSADLAAQQGQLKESLLRISGAIQVLEEMLGNQTKNTQTNRGTETNIMSMESAAVKQVV